MTRGAAVALGVGGAAAAGLAGWAVWRARQQALAAACAPPTLACLLRYPVGHLPGPDPAQWIPAQEAARLVAASPYDLFTLAHRPVGAFGPQWIPAQRAAAYLWDLGIDPAPRALYADLVAAHRATGVPLPLLLGVAWTESTFLRYGTVPNSRLFPPGGSAAQGSPVGLMQVSRAAATQVGLAYPAVVRSARVNALAGARYLAYLARRLGRSPTMPLGPGWQPVLAQYGEPGAESLVLAQNPAWLAHVTPHRAAPTHRRRDGGPKSLHRPPHSLRAD